MTEGLTQARERGVAFFELPSDWMDQQDPAKKVRPAPSPARVFDVGRPADLQANWEHGKFNVYGMPVNFYAARAPNEWGINAACSGLKSPYAMGAKAIETHLRNGISVIWMELPNPGDTRIQLKCLQSAVEHFFLNELSPVRQIFRPDHVRFATAHSTGGLCLTRLLSKPKLREQMSRDFKMAFMDAPFFDTANASVQNIRDATTRSGQLVARFSESAFRHYANQHADRLPQDTLGGRFFLNLGMAYKDRTIDATDMRSLKKIGKEAAVVLHTAVKTVQDLIGKKPFLFDNDIERGFQKAVYIEPTYGQIRKLQERGRKIYLMTAPFPEDTLPIIMAAGRKDPFSCPNTIRAMATKLGTEFIEADAKHNVLDQDEAVLNLLMNRFLAFKPVLIDMPETGAAIVVTETRLLLPWIQHRISTSLQHGAGALNAAASFFQRLRGRSVRDSEVGGEPESRPVDAGHALGLK